MSMDPHRWVKTIPFIGVKSNQEKYKLDSNRWVNTLPSKDNNTIILKDDNVLILSNIINSKSKSNSAKKYFLTMIVFVVGLILVSVIKNGTRNLQKEIGNLQASINSLKIDVHQTALDHSFITSPENISRLAKEYLQVDLAPYKKSQIKQLNKNTKILTKLEETKYEKNFKKISQELSNEVILRITKKIENKKTELRKLQEIYTTPEKLPAELKSQVVKKIEKTKTDLKKLYTNPKGSIDLAKAQKWAAFQVVKLFLGIPIIPR